MAEREHRRVYTFEQKVEGVRAHVDDGVPAAQAMADNDISSKSAFFRWCSAYRAEGIEALRPKKRGRPRKNY